jgi:hypothetical protein
MLSIKCLMIAILIALSVDRMSDNDSTPKRDINAVLRDHDKELLAIPNVVGVYVGAIETTGKPCLKVMIARAVSESDPPIPRSIEGYPVVTEITGEIRPLEHQ